MQRHTEDARRELPPGWQELRLGEVCEFAYGQGLPMRTRDHEGPVPVYGSNGIIGWHSESVTGGPTIVVGRKGSIGEVHFSPIPCWPIDTTYFIEHPKITCDLNWLAWWLKAVDLASLNKASAVPGLNREDAYEFPIPFPPLAEQNRIAAALNEQVAAVQRARAAAQAQLADANALPNAYLRQMLPAAGQIFPPEWRMVKLGEICTISARQVDPKIPEFGALPHVSAEDIESGTGRLLKLRSATEDGMISGKYLFESGSVLYSKIRPYLRKAAFAPFRGLCSADMYPLDALGGSVDPHYLQWLLLSQPFTDYADGESRRARMPKLNRDQLFAYSAPLPPLDEQRRTAQLLSEKIAASERLRLSLETQVAEISSIPAVLLRRAFAGGL